MIVKVYAEPSLEPVTLAELKLASGIDSGTFDGNLTVTQCLAYGSKGISAGGAYTHTGTGIDVLGKQAEVLLHCGTNTATGTNDTKIQESDSLSTGYTDWAIGAFDPVTTSNDNADFKKVYTGTKRYIRTASKVLLAACEFGTSILTNAPMVSDDSEFTELIANGRLSVENDTNKKIMQQTWDYRPQSWPSGDRLKIPFGNLWSLLSLTIVDSSCTETDGIYALKFTGANTTPATGTYTIVSSVITATTITGGGAGYVTAPTVATQSGDGSVTAALASVTWKDTAGTVTTLTAGTDYLVESNGDQCGFIVLPYQGSWPSGELYPSNPISIRFVCGWATQAEVPVTFKQAVKRHCINSYLNKGDDTVGAMITYDKTYRSQINLCGVLYDMDFL